MKNVDEVFKGNTPSENLEYMLSFLEASGFKNVDKLDLLSCAELFDKIKTVLSHTIDNSAKFHILFSNKIG